MNQVIIGFIRTIYLEIVEGHMKLRPPTANVENKNRKLLVNTLSPQSLVVMSAETKPPFVLDFKFTQD